MNEDYVAYLKSVISEHEIARDNAQANIHRCEAAIIIAREALAKYVSAHQTEEASEPQ